MKASEMIGYALANPEDIGSHIALADEATAAINDIESEEVRNALTNIKVNP